MNILGLDLGVGSIGWALIKTDNEYIPQEILGLGSRIISLTSDESDNFTKGKGVTRCAARTTKRTARKMLNRYQDRRVALFNRLQELDMISPNHYNGKTPIEVWQLRADAATPGNKLTLEEIGDVLRHLNQKRGYRHSKSDSGDSKQTEYVKNVNARWKELQSLNETPGQYAFRKLKESEIITPANKKVYTYRIKDKGDRVLPRQAYETEFDTIMKLQASYYPDILTDEVIADLKNIIFYQRPLKSCKHLVNYCEFESKNYPTPDGRIVKRGPKVAPKSSPLSEMVRIYEAVNNIILKNPANKRQAKLRSLQLSIFDENPLPKDARLLQYEYIPNENQRAAIADFLLHNEKLTETDLLKILGLKKSDGFQVDKNIIRGLKGSTTYCSLKKALGDNPDYENLLQFNIELEDSNLVDIETGEIIQVVSPSYMNQPLYKLWHLVYSISSREELAKNLNAKYGISDESIIDSLFAIDFTKSGFSNRSAKFMRKLLPILMQGYHYSEAAAIVGVNHSDSLTKEENLSRQLKQYMENIPKGELRQPIVEKILNQMINVVNSLISKFGQIDEIRIELARELKQSKEQRIETTFALGKREKENQTISQNINDLGLRASRRNIQKYRLYQETGGTCIYCGQPISIAEFLSGHGGEIEHIIPRSLLFDDSFSNKACACRECNQNKKQSTGYDFMESKGDTELNQYIARVMNLYSEKKISRTKRDRLLCEKSKIPTDFLERDLRQSQYIAKKAREILRDVCYNVHASSGSVTDFFRHLWGYDMILHNLNLDRYDKADLVDEIQIEHAGQIHSEKRIIDWTKRLDHRHHAIDALVIALTRQGYVQRLNNLNKERDNIYSDLQNQSFDYQQRFHLLEEWGSSRPHFKVDDVAEASDRIAISFKPGKKLSTPGKRYENRNGKRIIRQTGLAIPRGGLHEDTIYGKIKLFDGEKTIKFAFQNPHLIVDQNIRKKIETILEENNHDVKEALNSLKKNPLKNIKGETIDKIPCYKDEFVYRVKIEEIKYKNLDKIIDLGIRKLIQVRYDECEKDQKKYKQSLEEKPLTVGEGVPRIIKTVRCATGLNSEKMVSTRKDNDNKTIGYSKSGNNHHLSFYSTPDGTVEAMITSFWIGIKRKKFGIPIIIENPESAWDRLNNLPYSEDIEEVGRSLPLPDWKFLFSLQMNEMVLLGLSDEEIQDAVNMKDKHKLVNHLYRVQKLTNNQYVFRYHTATNVDMDNKNNLLGLYQLVSSYKRIKELNLRKVRVNCLGDIIFI